jgi:hypothetical protein
MLVQAYSHVRMLCRLLKVILSAQSVSLEKGIGMVINFVLLFVWKQIFAVSLKAVPQNLPKGAENKALMLVSFRRELVAAG